MLRGLLRLVLVIVILVAVAAFLFGYWSTGRISSETGLERPIGTAGERTATATEKARERGAEIGARAGEAAGEAREAMSDAGLTAKIKSKMALDDLVRARDIDVDTVNRTVTLRGTVQSEAERNRAVQLARETAGVSSVSDELQIRRP